MLVPIQKALLPGAFLVASLVAVPAAAEGVYKPYLDPAIPHHAAILDTLSRLEASPQDAQLHNDLGCLVAWDGFWRDALRSFEAASELAPKDSRPWFNAGLVEALRGEWGNARSRFRKAVKVDPGNWPAWWMLGFAEENLGHWNAATDAYSRSIRVDTSLFDPRVNPFAVATRLKSRVLLATYEKRRLDAALPFSNQLSSPSRVASFFQAKARVAPPAAPAEESKSGPVVTTVPPPGRPATATPAAEAPPARLRRGLLERAGRERSGQVDVAPAPARPTAEQSSEDAPPPGPGFGDESGAPAVGVPPGTVPPGSETGGPPRRVPTPGTGGAPGPGGA